MKTENKQYRLNRWYPTLPNDWKTEHDYVYYKEESLMVNKLLMTTHIINFKHLEYPDFWEEVKQPLFVTDDDIEIFDDTTEIISVSVKHHTVSNWQYRYLSKPLDCENFKHFGDEKNADKYIEDNKQKPLFVTEDGVEVFNDEPYIILKRNYEKVETVAHKNGDYRDGVIRFKHESNADEYIWRNKPLFSYEDFIKWGNIPYPRAIEQLAKKRI